MLVKEEIRSSTSSLSKDNVSLCFKHKKYPLWAFNGRRYIKDISALEG
jgi:hypothetical protein